MDKNKMKEFGEVGGKISKKVVMTGTMMVLLGAINVAVSTLFTEGTRGLKMKGLDDFLGNKKKTEDKKVEKVEAEIVEISVEEEEA